MTGGAILLYLAVSVPLALALASLLPALRPLPARLLWVAPLPGLAAALLVPAGTPAPLPGVLLGAGLLLDTAARLFLGFTTLLWLAAGLHARRTISERPAPFAGFWLLTMAGNMLAILAVDVIGFYMGFAALSLAAWGLVVHSGTAEARRAGRVTIRLAVLGETFLVMAFMLGAGTAGSILITDVRGAFAAAPARDLAIGLLIAGFGIKAGLMPLHVWLPLAHPAAPVPASAVLSGAIVKAGTLGLLRFLPLEMAIPGWGQLLVVAGLGTAFLGALIGLMQPRAKTALAYSTLSQMGLLCAVIGTGLAGPLDPQGLALLMAAVILYALHHGLAKGAMFLAVDALPGAPAWLKGVALLTALAIAGLPLTGGALAKAALKPVLPDGTVAALVTLSAVTTTLLMLHAWRLIARAAPKAAPGPRLPFLLLALAAPALSWWVAGTLGLAADPLAPAKLFAAACPVALGAAIALAAWRAGRAWPWRAPEGDLLLAYEALGARLAGPARWLAARLDGKAQPAS